MSIDEEENQNDEENEEQPDQYDIDALNNSDEEAKELLASLGMPFRA